MVMEKRNRQQSRQQCLSRFVGEVVEVSGGHIVRSTGRKDRHSKVYTAKGLRDRRLRLSAQTAIQFYDVQDRLGYDRPSKAVDWLMQNAKAAIDQLADLPSGHAPGDQCPAPEQPIDTKTTASTGYSFDTGGDHGGFFSASLESEAMEDSMKPFPRVTAYTPDLLFNPSGRTRDLRLSLQSFHEPISLHQSPDSTERSFCPGATNIAQCAAAGNKERMVWWNATNSCDGGGGDFAYNAAAPPAPQLVNSQFQLYTQREPLQSSNLPSSLRAWTSATALAPAQAFTPESYYGGFSGFNIPAQIQGEEEQNRISDNLRSATPE